MAREIRIPHKDIEDPDKITKVNARKFKENGLDIHKNEVVSLEDDHEKKERVIKVKNTKYFFMGG